MFSFRRDELMLSLVPPGAVRPIPPSSERRFWDGVSPDALIKLEGRANDALRQPIPQLTATMRLEGAPYKTANAARRKMLSDLTAGACAANAKNYINKLADVIWAISEQSDWCDPPPDEPGLPRYGRNVIDMAAIECCAALATCLSVLQPELARVDPELSNRVIRELTRRVLAPLSGDSRQVQIKINREDMFEFADAALMAALMTDFDGDQRWLCIRNILAMLERHMQLLSPDGGTNTGLERQCTEARALSNILTLISIASGGQVELRDEPFFARMAALPAALHIGGGWFVNPGGSPRPILNPEQIYLTGDSARLGEVCALAAYLARGGAREAQQAPVWHELQAAMYRTEFAREPVRLRQRPYVELPSSQIMAVRMDGFYVALTGGGNMPGAGHLDVGDLYLMHGGQPIIMDPGLTQGAAYHSVPEIELIGQDYTGLRPEDGGDFRREEHVMMMSIGIAHAYPRSAKLLSWQRTVIATPETGNVQLIDIMDFEHGEKKQVSFQFMTPLEPVLKAGAVALGDVVMTWSGDLAVKVEKVSLPVEPRKLWGESYYRLVFETKEPIPHGRYGFEFKARR